MSTGNTISVDPSELLSSPLVANVSTESTTLLQPQVEAQTAAPIELDSSSVVGVQQPPVAGGGGGGSSGSNTVSRRPGRPRRQALEKANATDSAQPGYASPPLTVNTSTDSAPLLDASTTTPGATTPTDSLPVPPGFAPPPPSSSTKRPRGRPLGSGRGRPRGSGRGRPRGSGTKKHTRVPTAPMPVRLDKRHGIITARDLKPHTIYVSPGEDLTAKIMAFAQQGNRDFFIASHYGAVSSATLREPTSSTGSTTYEGRYQIISLSGSVIQSEAPGGKRVWVGGLTVTLAGPDSRSVIVGVVTGPLIAATPIQVLLCSFVLPKEEGTEPGTVDPVNKTETGGPAAGGDVKESDGGGAGTPILDNFGGDVNESVGVGAGAGASTSILDNVGGDANESVGVGGGTGGGGGGGGGGGAGTSIPDNFGIWKDVNNPGT